MCKFDGNMCVCGKAFDAVFGGKTMREKLIESLFFHLSLLSIVSRLFWYWQSKINIHAYTHIFHQIIPPSTSFVMYSVISAFYKLKIHASLCSVLPRFERTHICMCLWMREFELNSFCLRRAPQSRWSIFVLLSPYCTARKWNGDWHERISMILCDVLLCLGIVTSICFICGHIDLWNIWCVYVWEWERCTHEY